MVFVFAGFCISVFTHNIQVYGHLNINFLHLFNLNPLIVWGLHYISPGPSRQPFKQLNVKKTKEKDLLEETYRSTI